MDKFIAYKNRGQYKGKPLYPHKHKDNTYVASSSRFEIDYIRVNSLEELKALVSAGLGARMSNPDIPQAASLIASDHIHFTNQYKSKTLIKNILPKLSHNTDLDSDSMKKTRKEQAFLRSYLIGEKLEGLCTICQQVYPIEFLVAAHIKKRSECSNLEKLDFDNVVTLMCKAGCDDLFEKGYIYIIDGIIQKNSNRTTTPALDNIINKVVGNTVPNWVNSAIYYDAHAQNFSKKRKDVD